MNNKFLRKSMFKDNKDFYYLKYKNENTGMLIYDFIEQKFSYEYDSNYKGIPPFSIMLVKSVENENINWNLTIREWISDRVIQRNRPDTKEVLELLELSYYDEWEICRKNLAMSIDDYFWITKDDDLKYEDINIRYCMINGVEPKYSAPFPIEKYPSKIEYLNESLNTLSKNINENIEPLKVNLKDINIFYNKIFNELDKSKENVDDKKKEIGDSKINSDVDKKLEYLMTIYNKDKTNVERIVRIFFNNYYNIVGSQKENKVDYYNCLKNYQRNKLKRKDINIKKYID